MRIIDMRICSECGREYNTGNGPCDRCDEETPEDALLRKIAEKEGKSIEELEIEMYDPAGPEDL